MSKKVTGKLSVGHLPGPTPVLSTLNELTIQVTKTSDGMLDYVQISSPAACPVNIVLIAKKIVIDDRRINN